MDARETAARAWELRSNMMRVALSILRRGTDAEDAISEAILKASGHCGELADERLFKPWLMRILVRCCYDAIRKRKREVLEEDFSTMDRPVLENEEGSVFELMQELPPHYRKVLILHYYEGFKAREIAHVLQTPTGTVLARLSRGRQLLRALIEREEASYAEQTV